MRGPNTIKMIQSIPRIALRKSQYTPQFFSTSTSQQSNTEDDEQGFQHQQEFVRERFTDPQSSWNNRARILSAEDFANRPRVNFSEEFNSLHDAGVVLSWIPAKQQDAIYQMYLDTMLKMHKTEKNGVTSHEYVMHLIASKFNMKPMRVAAIVQLLHNEDQIRKNEPDKEIHHDVQEYVDRKIAEHIQNAYSEYDEIDPQTFVETPQPYLSPPDSHKFVAVPDDLDLPEQLFELEKADKERKQKQLDTKLFIEDVDDHLRDVRLDPEARELLNKKKLFEKTKSKEDPSTAVTDSTSIIDIPPSEAARPRWKYVAQIISDSDSSAQKGKNKSKKKKKNKMSRLTQINNTIVEQNGSLRPATVAEASETSWKPTRDPLEFIIKGVKQAWLEKTLRGEVGGWGRVEAQKKPEKVVEGGTTQVDDIIEYQSTEDDKKD